MVKKVVTLDNLRVPFLTDGRIKILSFRSKDQKADPGVVPDDDICSKAGITVVKTEFQHNDFSDRGPESVQESIEAKVNGFLDEAEKASSPQLTAAAPSPSVTAADKN
jgi:hypothetical protein